MLEGTHKSLDDVQRPIFQFQKNVLFYISLKVSIEENTTKIPPKNKKELNPKKA